MLGVPPEQFFSGLLVVVSSVGVRARLCFKERFGTQSPCCLQEINVTHCKGTPEQLFSGQFRLWFLPFVCGRSFTSQNVLGHKAMDFYE